MSASVIEAVDRQYPELLRTNTKASDATFCQRAIEALGPPWGHLSKSDGENGFTFPNSVRVSVDAIAKPNGERVDIIGASDNAPSPGHPTWNVIPPEHWRPSNVYVPPQPLLSGEPAPPEPPEPVDPALPAAYDTLRWFVHIYDAVSAMPLDRRPALSRDDIITVLKNLRDACARILETERP